MFSMILLAIVGPNYECLYADIGSNGRLYDSDIRNNSDLQQKLENICLNIPDPGSFPYGNIRIPTSCVCR